ncbi:PREDICTED: LOW QUALITY PROTEIN: myosin-4-like [Branchiostoma belcheri]|uniref:LOW QUALITY PROTEIN: myosin-4-like n=1 Tax=Branchiostoma belcheri TaxID=7741 RepID=A0A6P4YTT1_BRABE|nr:PREDICTED: LOW QUALITY PROTEIN: myosin-4-like [Branchiostoma belcheri]
MEYIEEEFTGHDSSGTWLTGLDDIFQDDDETPGQLHNLIKSHIEGLDRVTAKKKLLAASMNSEDILNHTREALLIVARRERSDCPPGILRRRTYRANAEPVMSRLAEDCCALFQFIEGEKNVTEIKKMFSGQQISGFQSPAVTRRRGLSMAHDGVEQDQDHDEVARILTANAILRERLNEDDRMIKERLKGVENRLRNQENTMSDLNSQHDSQTQGLLEVLEEEMKESKEKIESLSNKLRRYEVDREDIIEHCDKHLSGIHEEIAATKGSHLVMTEEIEGMKGKWKKVETAQMKVQTTIATHSNKINSVETELQSLHGSCKRADIEKETKINRITTYAHNLAHSLEERLKEQELALSATHRMIQEIKDQLKTMGAVGDTSINELKNKEIKSPNLTEQHERHIQSLQQEIVHLKEIIKELTKHHDEQVSSLQQEIAHVRKVSKAHEVTMERFTGSRNITQTTTYVSENSSKAHEPRENQQSHTNLIHLDTTPCKPVNETHGETSEASNQAQGGTQQATKQQKGRRSQQTEETSSESETGNDMSQSLLSQGECNKKYAADSKTVQGLVRKQRSMGSLIKSIRLESTSPTSVIGHRTTKRYSTPRRKSYSSEGQVLSGQSNHSRRQQTTAIETNHSPQMRTEKNQHRSYKEALLQTREGLSNPRSPSHRTASPHLPGLSHNYHKQGNLTEGRNNNESLNKSTDLTDFVGVERHKVRRKRFFLGYLKKTDPMRLQNMIYKFAQNKGVQLSFVRIMASKQKDTAFARINVPVEQAHLVTRDNFWPQGVRCRAWVSETSYKVYMPYSGLAVETYREHLDIITEIYRKYENEGEVTLVGDFNADIGEQRGREWRPRGRGEGSKRGRELENTMEELALFSLNLSQLCKGPLYTFHDASGNHRSTIDHILVPYSLIAETVACEVMEDRSLNLSDHNPVVATFTNKPREWEEAMPRAKPRWHKADQEEKEMYRRRVKERLGASRAPTMMSTEDIDNELRTITTILIRTAEEVMPPKERKKHQKPYWTPDLTEVHQQEVEAWLQWKEGGNRGKDNQLYRAYKESKNRLGTELREAKNAA